MPKLKVFNADRAPSSVVHQQRATSDMFGGGDGMTKAGAAIVGVAEDIQRKEEKLAKARARINDRNDTIHRARALNLFKSDVHEEAQRFATEGDPANPDQTSAFGVFMGERAQAAIDSYAGTEKGKAQLIADIEKHRGKKAIEFSKQVNTAGIALIIGDLEENMAAAATNAAEHRSVIIGFDDVAAALKIAAPGATPVQEATYSTSGKAGVITAVFYARLNDGDVDGAKRALEADGAARPDEISEWFEPAALRKLRGEILTVERAREKGKIELQEKLELYAMVIGKVTPYGKGDVAALTIPEKQIATGLSGPAISSRPVGEQLDFIIQARKDHGLPPLTQSQMNIFLNAGTSPTSLRGLALQTVKFLSSGFANKTLSQAEERNYISAVVELTRPTKGDFNEATGRHEIVLGAIPPFVRDAFERRGLPLPTGTESWSSAPAPPVSQATPDKDDPNFLTTPDGTVIDIGAGNEVPKDKTIFARSSLIVGVEVGLRDWVGRLPFGIGDTLPAEAIATARGDARLLNERLVNALVKETSIRSQASRQALSEKLRINPETIRSLSDYWSALFSAHDILQVEINQAVKIIQNPASAAQTQEALDEIRRFASLQAVLGVPPLITTKEEYENLEDGTVIRRKDGRVQTVRKNLKEKGAGDGGADE